VRTETDLRQALAELAGTAPDTVTAASQIQLRDTATAATRPSRKPATIILAACTSAALVVALVAILVPSFTRQPEPAGPTLEEQYRGSMTINPSTARPGAWVSLGFPDNRTRGVAFTLEMWTGSRWTLTYYVISDRDPVRSVPRWWRSSEPPPGAGWPDLGIGGPGGERVIVPPVAAVGVYRLCTANPPEKACALLTIT
jgi:hypothetical protein